ncbi:uncharacterized protein YcfL [Mesocricetibacter intestinalis]|uniref:Uncharacterized protein YcfL n=1 Tax=Mesocricetibacter intestinalis TaxID=1521930 RepID=A0A4R6VBC9_9PAST|nr:DUF1425 domain-containing protein [Mesocricetibacter intestinalis]TDQ59558.1 uncharacterized protein YcfL [Mesocricetibacter intestinalis]
MKKYLPLIFSLVLGACSSNAPNLVRTTAPILNISAELAPHIEASVASDSAWVKNKTGENLKLSYDIFWYDNNGVTQPFSEDKESFSAVILLKPKQQAGIQLSRPSADSRNYRLYLH